MSDPQRDLAATAESFHEETPLQFQVSLTMSTETRDRLGRVRDDVNERAGERVFETDDAMRLALVAAARYHALASGDVEPGDVDESELLPLAAAVRRVLSDDPRVPDPEDDPTDRR